MNRRDFLTLSATGIVGLGLSSFPLPALARGKGEKEYSVILLGDTHFDIEPSTVYHAEYLKDTENISKARVGEFIRNGEMWKDRCPRLLKRAAQLADDNTKMVLQMGDLIQGDCGNAGTHRKMLADALDRMKGELPLQKIVDELYEWTARRMADAEENESFAQEMLLKRCAYHGLNFSAPFIVMRHWDKMQQDGQYWCGTFETDDVDWQLAELITNIQYACQCHFFGSLAESYFENKDKAASVNVQRRKKTYEAFSLLPEEFTVDDVMRCFKLNNATAAHMRIGRLAKDHLIEKKNEVREGSVYKAIYCKTGAIML